MPPPPSFSRTRKCAMVRPMSSWESDMSVRVYFATTAKSTHHDATGSDVQERLIEVGDDVFDVFDADGQANQAFGDANAFLHFFGHGRVGHQRREGNQ